MAYERGVFKKYYNVSGKSILLSGSTYLKPGDYLEFDGNTVVFGPLTYESPATAGAVIKGWLSENEGAVLPEKETVAPKMRVSEPDDFEVATIKEEKPMTSLDRARAVIEAQKKPITKVDIIHDDSETVKELKPVSKTAAVVSEDDRPVVYKGNVISDESNVVKKVASPIAKPIVINDSSDVERRINELEGPKKVEPIKNIVKVEGSDEEFVWDVTAHWKTRVVEAVKKYGKDEAALAKIMAVENEKVKNLIKKALEQQNM